MDSSDTENEEDGGGRSSPELTGRRGRSESGSRGGSSDRSLSRDPSPPAGPRRIVRSSSRDNSSERKLKIQSDNDSGEETKTNGRKFYKSLSRSRSKSSSSRSVSRSKTVSRSPSRSVSRKRSLSRSPSRSISPLVSKRSKIRSRSRSSSVANDSDDAADLPKQSLGLEISDSENENDDGDITAKKAFRVARTETAVNDDSSDDEGPIRRDEEVRGALGNDFDNMMERKRALNRRIRKKKDIDVINTNDDAIASMLADMRIAAKEDRDLNEAGLPATKKMTMFKRVMQNLGKVELQMAFIEANLLSVMTDWLAPMPDKSLPHVLIRTSFLKLLGQVNVDETSRLKESGIGKAVMYLYRHPRETRENKEVSGRIISEWARPIFHKEADFARLTKEDRRENDDLRARRAFQGRKRRKVEEAEEQNLKPGDPGWVDRARVPMPDNAEYIKRPEWQNHTEIVEKKQKKEITLLEKHKRKFQERKRLSKNLSLVKISIEGARMGLGQ